MQKKKTNLTVLELQNIEKEKAYTFYTCMRTKKAAANIREDYMKFVLL